MGLESVNHISDLVSSNPLAGDNVSQGDDHIRNIKKALLADFPNINDTVNATPTQLDYTVVNTLGTAEPSKALTVSIASTMTFNGMTVQDLGTVTTADINGGTLDDVAIGETTRSSVKATTLNASQSLVLATGATVTGISDDDTMASDSAVLLPTQAAAKGYTDTAVAAIFAVTSATRANEGHLEFATSATLGVAVNWGQTGSVSSDQAVTFAKAFSTTPYCTIISCEDNNVNTDAATTDSVTNTGMTLRVTGTSKIWNWIAIGPTTL